MQDAAADVRYADLIEVTGPRLGGRFVVLCDHASNRIPAGFPDLGLTPDEMQAHIAWDPGALPVADRLAALLSVPLVYPDASRLLIDCNRDPSATDSIATISEQTAVPGNEGLDAAMRRQRVVIYDRYHAAIEAVLDERAASGVASALVAIHSFTPVYRHVARPWEIGILFDADRRLADPLIARLEADGFVVGINEPYSPADGVYHTLDRHGTARGLPTVMIEIRNDLLTTPQGQEDWAGRLAPMLREALAYA